MNLASFLIGAMLSYPLVLALGLWRPGRYEDLIGGGRLRFFFVLSGAAFGLFVVSGLLLHELPREPGEGLIAALLGLAGAAGGAFWMARAGTSAPSGRESSVPPEKADRAAAAIFERGLPELPAAHPVLPATPDAPEELAPAEGGAASARLVLIEYRDANGNRSARRITMQSVFPKNGDFTITAYCHERKAQRTFIASRIITIADPFTGEINSDPVGFIKQFVLFESGSMLDETGDVIREMLPMIVILVALARCDGIFAREEVNFIADLVRARARGRSYDSAHVMGLVRALFPTESDVARAFRSLSGEGDLVTDAMRRLIAIDGRSSSEEEAFIERLSRTLSGETVAAPVSAGHSGDDRPASPRQVKAVGQLGCGIIGLTWSEANRILNMRDYLWLLMDRIDKGRVCDDEAVLRAALGRVRSDQALSSYLGSDRIRRAVQSERLPTGPEREALTAILQESGLA